MRVKKTETGYFFDAFKHFKNNISNLIFYEFPLLIDNGVSKYFNIKSVNYKSKYPDMKKIGLIEYEKTDNFTVSDLAEKILPLLQNYRKSITRFANIRLDSIGSDIFNSEFYNSDDYKKISDAILEMELNYYDDAVSIRPYFVLLKIILKNKIQYLSDEVLLNILSMKKSDALQLKYIDDAFSKLNKELQVEIKRPKSYIYDFIKTSKIINDSKKVTIDVVKVTSIITRMNEVNTEAESQQNIQIGRIGQSDFRSRVLQAYNYTCALTGKKIAYPSKYNRNINYVLDAAHIIPYADGGSFSVNNGIALSPEIHTLYDLGIITFKYNENDDLICVVSHKTGVSGGDYLKSLDGKKLNLPEKENYWPDEDALIYKESKYFLHAS